MTKIYCDVCGKDIVAGMLGGGLMRTLERFPVLQVPGGVPGDPTKMSPVIQRQIGTEVWELCSDCKKFFWDIAEKRKKQMSGNQKPTKDSPKSQLIKS